MTRPSDAVLAALRTAKGPGDVWRALSQDKILLIGLVVLLVLFILFLRIYLWPWLNPFTWISDLRTWLTTPRDPPPPQATYPFAKDLYPTYR